VVTVYGLASSADGKIRYVGQTAGDLSVRHKGHLVSAKRFPQRHRSKWIKSVLADGELVTVFVIESDAVENEAEIRWISWYKRHGAQLVNGTDGGEGTCGHDVSKGAREKLRVANLGKKQSEETKQKRAEKHRGATRPSGTGAKISAAKLGKPCPWVSERNKDPANEAKIARWALIPKRGYKMTDAQKEAVRQRQLAYWKKKRENRVA
jgi:hypothetical protein